jgi:hypothetical protein
VTKRWRVALTVAGCLASSACTYHNTIYNTQRLYEQAERSRRAGRDSLANQLYQEVIRKAAEAYRARPSSDWSGEALFLLGRSRLRLGELFEAHAALLEAEARGPRELRPPIRAYVAAVLAARGEATEAMAIVEEVTAQPLPGPALAEARLVAGQGYLAKGQAERGWWELDRAVDADPAIRVEAGLERLKWAVRRGDRDRARAATDLLLSYPEGGARLTAVGDLLEESLARWGPAATADLLTAAASSSWDREARGRLRLVRARLLSEGGDAAGAEAEAWEVAGTLGDAAAEARIQLALWELGRSEDLADAYAVRRILLPAGAHPGVSDLVDAVGELELYTNIGLGEPLGWFAAAEVARDRLDADYLARGLFLAYADGAPTQPWAPKALLAALEVTSSEVDRAWLRGRLEAHDRSPYVLAAHGSSGAGFEALEEELQVRLRELRGR